MTSTLAKTFLDRAFQADFHENGPSLFRLTRVMFDRWKRYQRHPDARVRERLAREARQLRSSYAATLWAMEKYLRKSNEAVSGQIATLRHEIRKEFGAMPSFYSRLLGPVLLWSARRETRRLREGTTYEPPTFIERTHWA